MSNAGQGLLTIGGFLIGAAIGYPQLGFLVGSLVGSALFPTKLPGVQGPRLSDTKTTTAQLGAPLMEVFGMEAVPGVVMWMADVVEIPHTETQGGKGGPEQSVTTYSYTQSIAVGLCRGPMGGLRRIWENGKLVYDIRSQQEDESDQDFEQRIIGSQAYATGFVLYLGDEEQEPDPTIELDKGIGNVPPFRGLMYIVYPDRLLREEQALRHPSFKFEVYDEGALVCEEVTQYSTGVAFDWVNSLSGDPRNPLNRHIYEYALATIDEGSVVTNFEQVTTDDFVEVKTQLGNQLFGNLLGYVRNDETFGDLSDIKNLNIVVLVFSEQQVLTKGLSSFGVGTGPPEFWQHSNYSYAPNFPPFLFNPGGKVIVHGPDPNAAPAGGLVNRWFIDPYDYYVSLFGMEICGTGPHPEPDEAVFNYYKIWPNTDTVEGECPEGLAADRHTQVIGYWERTRALNLTVRRVIRAPDKPCHPSGLAPLPQDYPGYCFVNGKWEQDTDWEFAGITAGALVLQAGGVHNNTPPIAGWHRPIGPVIVGDSDPRYYDQEFWERAYSAAVAAGDMSPGLPYVSGGVGLSDGIGYPTSYSGETPYGEASGAPNWAYQRTLNVCTVEVDRVSIATIVRKICQRVGLTDIDVSDLETLTVNGYVVSRVMNAREAIEPLRSVGFFDYVESGSKLKFVARGKPATRTFSLEDLGARESGNDDSQPSVTTTPMQDVELPRRVRVHYRALSRDYEEGEQISPTRLTTEAVNDTDIELAVTLEDSQAAKVAEILWADAWAGRWAHEISVDSEHAELEPTDCAQLPVDGFLERVRIISIDESAGFLRKLSLVRDDDGSYISSAVASVPERPVSILAVRSLTELILLDIPALRAVDNDVGVYAVIRRGSTGNTWNGASLYRSLDDGESFTLLESVTGEATTGLLGSPIPVGETTVFDDTNTVLVHTFSGSFSSKTDDELFEGANLLAVGMDGRVELLQFGVATQVAVSQWELSHLLRGRRGTEHLMGTSEIGDFVALVSGTGILRLSLANSYLGEEVIYKSVTLGAGYATGTDTPFTSHGVALLPFSPVSIEGSRDIDGNLTVSFIRRDRLGAELPDGSEIAMSEAVEAYELDVVGLGSPSGVLRTLTSSVASFTYTAAQQIEDFGGLAPEVFVRVYQISAVVGRGTPGEAMV